MVKSLLNFNDAGLRPRVAGEQIKKAETVIRHRNHQVDARDNHARKKKQQKESRKILARTDFVTVRHLVKRAQRYQRDTKRFRRIASRQSAPRARLDAHPCVLFVIRNGVQGPSSAVQKKLNLLGLSGSAFQGVFVENTPETTQLLRLCSPFVIYGSVDADIIKELLSKRGRLIIGPSDASEEVIIDNVVLEEVLGEHRIYCVEDLISQICSCGTAFQTIMKVLAPIRLTDCNKASGLLKVRVSGLVDLDEFRALLAKIV